MPVDPSTIPGTYHTGTGTRYLVPGTDAASPTNHHTCFGASMVVVYAFDNFPLRGVEGPSLPGTVLASLLREYSGTVLINSSSLVVLVPVPYRHVSTGRFLQAGTTCTRIFSVERYAPPSRRS
jgi:hypothetical protein